MKHKHGRTSNGNFTHRTQYFATRHQNKTQISFKSRHAMNNDVEENNLSRFWRECRERDMRKRRCKISKNQFMSNDHHYKNTIQQLKLDSQMLLQRMQRFETKKNKQEMENNKENRRHSMGPNALSDTAQYRNKESNRRMSNIYRSSANPSNKHNQSAIHENKESENCKIFFENKKYFSSLHNKHNHNKSNIECVHNYFDSLRNDETKLKNKIQQKWNELKKDVNKLNYFQNKKKVNQPPSSPINSPPKHKKEHIHNLPPKPAQLSQESNYYPTKPAKSSMQFREHKSSVASKVENPRNIITNEYKDPEPQQMNTSDHDTTQTASEIIENELNDKSENIEDENSSSFYHLSHLQKSNEYWDFSVRQLKNKLLNMNISIDECIEKKDLIQKLKEYNEHKCDKKQVPKMEQKLPKKVNTQRASTKSRTVKKDNKPSILYETVLNDTRESKQQLKKRVDLWVARWSYRRSFRQLLNCVLGYKATDKHYISRGIHHDEQNYEHVMKLYKKAILLIHPDRHIKSCFEVKYKSEEMFKVITTKCDKYRQRYKK